MQVCTLIAPLHLCTVEFMRSSAYVASLIATIFSQLRRNSNYTCCSEECPIAACVIERHARRSLLQWKLMKLVRKELMKRPAGQITYAMKSNAGISYQKVNCILWIRSPRSQHCWYRGKVHTDFVRIRMTKQLLRNCHRINRFLMTWISYMEQCKIALSGVIVVSQGSDIFFMRKPW